MSGALMIGAFLVAIALRVPVSLSMGAAAVVALLAAGLSDAWYVIPQQMVEAVYSVPLMAVPFFILAATIMNETGLTEELFNLASVLVGRLRGGLAQVNVAASLIFAGITGAAVADAAGLGAIEVRAMTARGYPRAFSAAISAASSVVGPIIPPSIPLVIYAYTAGVSTGRVLLAGILPGFLIGAFLMLMNHFIAIRRGFPRENPVSLEQALKTLKASAPALLTPAIIVGSMLTGVVTATEAGVLASAWAAAVSLWTRRLTREKLYRILEETTLMSGIIMFLIAVGKPMGWALAFEQIPSKAAQAMLLLSSSPAVFLLLLIVFLLIVGTVVEGIPAMLITLPVLLPIADRFGIDRVHFGLIVVYGLLIGLATPPVGIGLYIMTQVAGVSFEEVTREILIYLIPLVAALFVIAYWPALSLWIPSLVFR